MFGRELKMKEQFTLLATVLLASSLLASNSNAKMETEQVEGWYVTTDTNPTADEVDAWANLNGEKGYVDGVLGLQCIDGKLYARIWWKDVKFEKGSEQQIVYRVDNTKPRTVFGKPSGDLKGVLLNDPNSFLAAIGNAQVVATQNGERSDLFNVSGINKISALMRKYCT
ncbi:MAG: hypothetical protein ACR2OJ_00375 [Hyphomicrobiales bacterium]